MELWGDYSVIHSFEGLNKDEMGVLLSTQCYDKKSFMSYWDIINLVMFIREELGYYKCYRDDLIDAIINDYALTGDDGYEIAKCVAGRIEDLDDLPILKDKYKRLLCAKCGYAHYDVACTIDRVKRGVRDF